MTYLVLHTEKTDVTCECSLKSHIFWLQPVSKTKKKVFDTYQNFVLLLGEEGSDTETEKGRVTEKSLLFFLICSDVTRNSLPISFKINFFCSLVSPRISSFFVHFRHLNHLQLSFISCLKFSWNIKIFTFWIDRCVLKSGSFLRRRINDRQLSRQKIRQKISAIITNTNTPFRTLLFSIQNLT